ncbi:DUF924 family protein [Aspergillus homomorphus CBS 101889]|uniref:SpoVR like family protein n=1 Tax=Aspergillus homomorphus (strain CBS 101889) TaxID=1450537 RepID=A0A395HVI0_ASPHC|nr:SpoVR like family protein [Aspergillus homomorphus CBS 101889]RAL10224.1 SpoVR like family protein [Aspergillus homomorphus CBS 101889]
MGSLNERTAPKGAITDLLTPTFLKSIRDFWFQHCRDETELVLPKESSMQRWFSANPDMDRACSVQFRRPLETILHSAVTPTELFATAQAFSSPLDWLSLVLLLDQIPRNCFRNQEAAIVYRTFDPLALKIALHALDDVVVREPPLRYAFTYRMWFYMPIMHSEDLEIHQDIAPTRFALVSADVERLLSAGDEELGLLGPHERHCYQVLKDREEKARAFVDHLSTYEKTHAQIIERFGRYPHRNRPLERTFTGDEVAYLKSEGETFGVSVTV